MSSPAPSEKLLVDKATNTELYSPTTSSYNGVDDFELASVTADSLVRPPNEVAAAVPLQLGRITEQDGRASSNSFNDEEPIADLPCPTVQTSWSFIKNKVDADVNKVINMRNILDSLDRIPSTNTSLHVSGTSLTSVNVVGQRSLNNLAGLLENDISDALTHMDDVRRRHSNLHRLEQLVRSEESTDEPVRYVQQNLDFDLVQQEAVEMLREVQSIRLQTLTSGTTAGGHAPQAAVGGGSEPLAPPTVGNAFSNAMNAYRQDEATNLQLPEYMTLGSSVTSSVGSADFDVATNQRELKQIMILGEDLVYGSNGCNR